MKPYYKKGEWNYTCPVCQQVYKSGNIRRRWDGLMVCKTDWEPRHPQDMIRGIPDHTGVPEVSPDPSGGSVDTSGWAATGTSLAAGTFDSNNGTL